MQGSTTRSRNGAVILAASALSLIATSAFGAPVTFDVQQALSTLTVTGSTSGIPFLPQTTGSNATSFTGTINADITGSTLTFGGGSSVDANPQATAQQPRADGTPGSATADYGFLFNTGIFGNALLAARGVNFDVTSGAITVGGTGVLSGATTLTFNAGEVDYNAGITFGEYALAGSAGPNVAPGVASLSTAAGVQTLTLPISASYTASVLTTNDTTLTVTGQLVATRNVAVPEPIALTSLAAVGSIVAVRRRRA